MFGEQFYPTPKSLVEVMIKKIDFKKGINSVLDPSAGKGDLLMGLFLSDFRIGKLKAIEIDYNLQSILRNTTPISFVENTEDYRHMKSKISSMYYRNETLAPIEVIDSDFLLYNGQDQFDLIIMNPPFKDGHKHLLKAIEILYSGQILCILNAETIRNPKSYEQEKLVDALEKMGADIQYINDAFVDAERKTSVEIALIYIQKYQDIESELFSESKEIAKDFDFNGFEEESSLTKRDSIEEIVDRYNHIKQIGIDTIIDYYKNYKWIGKYFSLSLKEMSRSESKNLTGLVKEDVNEFLSKIRESFWTDVMKIDAIAKNLTRKKADQVRKEIQKHSKMEFSVNNIRAFVVELMKNFPTDLEESIEIVFDNMTIDYSYYPETKKNRLHFDSWKSNNAFKVNKKVILPGYDFAGWSGKKHVDYNHKEKLDDIDKIMSYFDGKLWGEYVTIEDALNAAFKEFKDKKIESEYFIIDSYKKGTLHLTFKDDNILRRFNVAACKAKKWLPHNYSTKEYKDMKPEEKDIVDKFEGKGEYKVDLSIMETAKIFSQGLLEGSVEC